MEHAQSDRSPSGAPLTLDALKSYLEAESEDRWAAEERAQSLLARLFKLAIAMVCLNVVIAGANVAMIALRPSAHPIVVPAPPAPQPAATTANVRAGEPTAPAAPASLYTPLEVPVPEPAPLAPPVEKKTPLLGPLLGPSKPSLVVAARRPARPQVMPSKAALTPDLDDDLGGRPERW